jgi:hypothetical protein
MSNQIFHYSNTGILSGQRFYLKDDVSGIFIRNLKIDSNFPVVASNLVYNTGNQTISGVKTFYSPIYFSGAQVDGNGGYIDLRPGVLGVFNGIGGNAGSIDLRGGDAQDGNGGSAGSISLRGGFGVDSNGAGNGGSIIADGSNGGGDSLGVVNAGSLNMSAGDYLGADGGSIDTSSVGGSIITRGYINRDTPSYVLFSGGSINTSASNNFPGGSINLSSNGGANFSIQSANLPTQNNGSIYNKINDALYIRKNSVWEKVITDKQNPVYTTGDQTISGIKTFNVFPIVSGNKLITGVNLSILNDKIDSLSGVSVLTFGNQNVFGTKSFISNTFFDKDITVTGNIKASGTAFFNNNLNVANNLNISGNLTVAGNINNPNLVLTSTDQTIAGTKTFNVAPIFNGNPLITETNLLSYALSSQVVYKTGEQSIAGLKTFSSNAFFSNDVNVTQNLRVAGNSFFTGDLSVTGNFTVGGSLSAPNVVLTRGRQTISGVKTFANELNLNAYTGNGYDNTNNEFRLNIGGDTNENVGIQIDAYGTNPPQILMRRARGIPTGLSGVLKDDVLFNLQARGYVSGLNAYSTNSRAAIRLIAAEDWVGGGGYNNQGTYILFRTTNTGTSSAINKVIIGTSGINLLDGNIYISGNPVVNTTSNQTIFGSKTFATGAIYLGTSIISAKSGISANNGIGGVGGNIYLDGGNSYSAYNAGVPISGGNGGYIDLRGGGTADLPYSYPGGNGGFIELRGQGDQDDAYHGNGGYFQANGNIGSPSNGGFIELNANASANGGYIKLNAGPNGAVGGYIEANGFFDNDLGYPYPGGFINLNSTNIGSGGNINASNGGGSIYTCGDRYGGYYAVGGNIYLSGKVDTNGNIQNGGNINLSAGGGNIQSIGGNNYFWFDEQFNPFNQIGGQGGSINLDGGNAVEGLNGANGGSINLSNGGGSIDTRGQGQIQFGFDSIRTTLSGTASQNRTISLPDANGTLALDNNIAYTTGNQTISGIKTFLNNIAVSGTGSFNNVKVSNIDKLFLSGIDIVITGNSSVNVYNAIYISGNKVFTGVNTFTITLTHSSANPSVGLNYFGMNDVGYSQASLGSRRRMPIAETCQIRKASWSHFVGTLGNPSNLLSTGYVINTSSTPPQTGIVSTTISSASDTTPAHYITNFSPPIDVTSGDLIVAALGVSGFTIAPASVRDTVILYCYN